MKIARVFPRRTRATPVDGLAFTDVPPLLCPPEVDEVHVSVTFTWDMRHAEYLAAQWQGVAPVRLGGPAFNEPGAAFVPGRYLRDGYVITSRGCPNRCWFCSVWRREPRLTELPICDGYNVLDDNLLACSERHIREVFAMLKRQEARAQFTGGLEARRLLPWHIDLLAELRPEQMFLAWDTPDDEEPLRVAVAMLRAAGFTRHHLRAYVLIGYPQDSISGAELRLRQCVEMGVMPMAMLWRNDSGIRSVEWMKFARQWARPALIASHYSFGTLAE